MHQSPAPARKSSLSILSIGHLPPLQRMTLCAARMAGRPIYHEMEKNKYLGDWWQTVIQCPSEATAAVKEQKIDMYTVWAHVFSLHRSPLPFTHSKHTWEQVSLGQKWLSSGSDVVCRRSWMGIYLRMRLLPLKFFFYQMEARATLRKETPFSPPVSMWFLGIRMCRCALSPCWGAKHVCAEHGSGL